MYTRDALLVGQVSGHVDDWLTDFDNASDELVASELESEGNELERVELLLRMLDEETAEIELWIEVMDT